MFLICKDWHEKKNTSKCWFFFVGLVVFMFKNIEKLINSMQVIPVMLGKTGYWNSCWQYYPHSYNKVLNKKNKHAIRRPQSSIYFLYSQWLHWRAFLTGHLNFRPKTLCIKLCKKVFFFGKISESNTSWQLFYKYLFDFNIILAILSHCAYKQKFSGPLRKVFQYMMKTVMTQKLQWHNKNKPTEREQNCDRFKPFLQSHKLILSYRTANLLTLYQLSSFQWWQTSESCRGQCASWNWKISEEFLHPHSTLHSYR